MSQEPRPATVGGIASVLSRPARAGPARAQKATGYTMYDIACYTILYYTTLYYTTLYYTTLHYTTLYYTNYAKTNIIQYNYNITGSGRRAPAAAGFRICRLGWLILFTGWATGPLRKGFVGFCIVKHCSGHPLRFLASKTVRRKKDPCGPPRVALCRFMAGVIYVCFCWFTFGFRASPAEAVNSFQTTRTPNPEQVYTCYSVMKQCNTCFWMCSSKAFKFRCWWSGTRSDKDSYLHSTAVCGKTVLQKTKQPQRKISFQSTKSWAGVQFLPQDYRSRAPEKGVLFSQRPVRSYSSLFYLCVLNLLVYR